MSKKIVKATKELVSSDRFAKRELTDNELIAPAGGRGAANSCTNCGDQDYAK